MTFDYKWIPGIGPDQNALKRMSTHVKKPKKPMGEDWFMGAQREMYTYLVENDLRVIDIMKIERALVSIASGTSCFGPMDEWHEWFHYFLPNLIPTALEDSGLQELLVTALMTQYPFGITGEDYREFREDMLQTLGQILMHKSKWNGDQVVLERTLIPQPADLSKGWGWWNASGDLSSCLFLCVKYLTASEINAWVQSICAISDPHWRAQFLIWLVGSVNLLTDHLKQPGELEDAVPSVGWNWSWCLKGNYTGLYDGSAPPTPFISGENSSTFKAAIRSNLIESRLSEWIRSIESIEYLNLEALPFIVDLENLYK